MSFFENINSVFETKFNVVPKPGGGSSGGAGDWNTLANRPFGYVEHYDLLAETAVTFSGSDPAIGGLSLSASLTEGMAYPVNFDGTQYLCRYESGKLGNLALEDGTDTGEPFLWYVTERMILTTAGAGTHTVSLQGDVVQRVPWEYMPFGYVDTVIFSNSALTLFDMNGMVGTTLENIIKPVPDVEYSVMYNGTNYKCKYLEMSDESGGLGNLGVITGDGDTGEPFAIVFESGIAILVALVGNAGDTISLTISGKHPTKLPDDQIPEPVTINLQDYGIGQINYDDEPAWYPFSDFYLFEEAMIKGLQITATIKIAWLSGSSVALMTMKANLSKMRSNPNEYFATVIIGATALEIQTDQSLERIKVTSVKWYEGTA